MSEHNIEVDDVVNEVWKWSFEGEGPHRRNYIPQIQPTSFGCAMRCYSALKHLMQIPEDDLQKFILANPG